MKQISVGQDVVWALDTTGRLSVRREVKAKIFPEGTYWQTLPAMPNDPIHIGAKKSLLDSVLPTFISFDFTESLTKSLLDMRQCAFA